MNRQEYNQLSNTKNKELAILECSEVTIRRQSRPYTFIELEIYIGEYVGGEIYCGSGFSKVSFPDKWDSGKGEIAATQRAVRDIRKQLEGNES